MINMSIDYNTMYKDNAKYNRILVLKKAGYPPSSLYM